MTTRTFVLDTEHIDEVRRIVGKYEEAGWTVTHTEGRWFEHTFIPDTNLGLEILRAHPKGLTAEQITKKLEELDAFDRAPHFTGIIVFGVDDGAA